MMSCCRNINRACAIFSLAAACVFGRAEEGRTPGEELKTFALEPGLKAELVAAEPLVVAPVALCFDEQARMYVAENRGYPTQAEPPIGRIAMLQDKNGDGLYETRHDYAEGLSFPNGVLAWDGGLYVTCAPDVFYLKDSDGDGKADVRKVVLTGFGTNGSTQLRVSHPTLGPDGWIYLAGGLVGGKVTSPDHPEMAPLDLSRNDVRFRPGTHEYRPTDGKGQFGLTFDDFGHRFFCMNRIHVQHVVLESRYLTRNPRLAFTDTVENAPGELVPEPLKGHRPAARIFPLSKNITTADSHAGTFTAACGVMIYRGSALPEEYRRNVFACDPAANLVHRDILVERGGTFVAQRAGEEKEVLASSDDWFRPVFLANGPDGAIYVCDMYRKTIEHPDYLPEEVRKRTDFKSGSDLGRIWRITGTEKRQVARVSSKNPEQLYEQLGHRDGWVRETAFRLVSEQGKEANGESLRKELSEGDSAEGRFLAISLLSNAEVITEDDLLHALGDDSAGVRELAIYLAEGKLNASQELQRAVLEKADEPSSHVRFQAALSLGEMKEKKGIAQALAEIARRAEGDRWTHAAVLSSATGIEAELAETIAEGTYEPAIAGFVSRLGGILAQTGIDDFVRVLEKSANPEFQVALLAGADERNLAATIGEKISLETRAKAAKTATKILARKGDAAARILAFRALGLLDRNEGAKLALAALNPSEPLEIHRAAIDLLGREKSTLENLAIEKWSILSPSLREHLLNKLLAADETTLFLLERIQSGKLPLNVLPALQRKQVQQRKSEAVKTLAAELFGASSNSDRQKVFNELKEVLQLQANARAGQEVFLKQCAACHRLDREGHEVGPDLFSIRNQPKEAILLHLVDPDYEIVPGFAAYNIETSDGESFSGLLKSETETAVTLRMAGGLEEVIPRSRVAKLTSSSVSLMPQELEKTMSRQELADLLAYLKGE